MVWISSSLMPTMASPRFSDRRASRSASCQLAVACTMAAARLAGSPDLKMPEPTNTPSAPSSIMRAASAGVATPPAAKLTTGRRPLSCTYLARSYGTASCLAASYTSSSRRETSSRICLFMVRMWRTAWMTSPVPGSPLVRIMDAPSAIRRSASPRFFAPHTNGTSNWFLSMWYTSSAGLSTSDSSM